MDENDIYGHIVQKGVQMASAKSTWDLSGQTEDAVCEIARSRLGLANSIGVRAGVGQRTTFNQLGFPGIADKPDGWYLPDDKNSTALIVETKAPYIRLDDKCVKELLKNVRIANMQYDKVVGILYNGEYIRVFKNDTEIETPDSLQPIGYYLALFEPDAIDKERIFELTSRINNRLHFEFGIKNLYHRMIFTACALVAKRYGAFMAEGMDYSEFHNAILNCLNKELIRDKQQNRKLNILTDVFSHIEMNLDVESETEKHQLRVRELIAEFIGWVTEISECINSDAWHGEDVMGIFFNEFNRYKKKSDAGQVFTPEHITDFMYRILDVGKDDRILDAAAGSGGFLVKAMANMIREAGGVATDKAAEIMTGQIFGIEFDKEIYALACANMLIHRDGKTNLEQMDARTHEAGEWIRWLEKPVTDSSGRIVREGTERKITKVLMNPPFENKYGCMRIVENVLDNVPIHTQCAFILPSNKLEKMKGGPRKRLLKHHRLCKIIKLPGRLFMDKNGLEDTSVFVFESGVPQNDREIFGCHMADDGLVTVKNKGRHDLYGRWQDIEDYWVDVVAKQSGDESCQWIDPREHLQYQEKRDPFSVSEAHFRKVATEYHLAMMGIRVQDFTSGFLKAVLYGSRIEDDGTNIKISITHIRQIGSNPQRTCDPTLANGNSLDIDYDGWVGFPIGGDDGLFRIERGDSLTKKDMVDGVIPFIGASRDNNGVTQRIGNSEHVRPGNLITVSNNGQKATGAAFYQPNPFWASSDVNVLYPRFEMNPRIALFLLPILRIVGEPYNYNNKWTPDAMAGDCLPLPADKNGAPDWEFMDGYMAKVMAISESTILAFSEFA